LEILKKTGNDGILQVKGNQKFLFQSCERTAENEKPVSTSTSRTRGHGRREKRTAEVFATLRSFSASVRRQWRTYVKAVIRVTRTVISFNTKTKRFEKRFEEAWYVSTTAAVTATEANRFIRAHWGIENRNHYVRDVTLGEDLSRIRKNPDRMVRLRSFALNILRANDVSEIKLTRFENTLSFENVLRYKGIF
jgi:predicted transposase YbfD/YdcC